MTRPTIVIAYGEYGYRVLHSLLANSSKRGLLEWSNSKRVNGGKALRNLELVWLTKPGQMIGMNTNLDDPIYKELYQQVKKVEIGHDGIGELTDAVKSAQSRLLAPDQLIQNGERIAPSLDVFFLASLANDQEGDPPESLTTLDSISQSLISFINTGNRRYAFQYDNNPTLNFIEILDYNNLTSEESELKSGRSALKESVRKWEKDRAEQVGSRGFGRIYVCDGSGITGDRPLELRRKEVVLFLEFLLFESVRVGELSGLFESSKDASILSSFGIRLGEQNVEALSQHAAAKFSKGWIDYLSGDALLDEQKGAKTIKTIGAVNGVDIESVAKKVHLSDDVKKTIELEVSKANKELANRSELNIEEILERLEVTFINAESKAAQEISHLLSDIRENDLSNFKEQLIAAVSEDLNTSRNPVPIGRLINIIEGRINNIDLEIERRQKTYKQTEIKDTDEFLNMTFMRGTVERFYGWYERFKKNRIDYKKLRFIWIGFSFLLSMLYLPSIVNSLLNVSTEGFVGVVSESPLVVFFALMLLTSIAISIKGERYIVRRLKAAEDWFTQIYRGRLTHALNAVSKNDKLFGKLNDDIYHSLYSEVQQSLYEVKDSLNKRKKEMGWLSRSLTDLEKRYHLNDDSYDGAQIRFEINGPEDLEKIQKTLPLEIEKYADRVDNGPPCFESWQDRYNSVFLSPLSFVEKLSKLYSKPFNEKIAQDEDGANKKEIINFLKNSANNLSVGLNFPEQEGLGQNMEYALLSKEFIGDREIDDEILGHFDISPSNIIQLSNSMRIYLLSVQMGIKANILECNH